MAAHDRSQGLRLRVLDDASDLASLAADWGAITDPREGDVFDRPDMLALWWHSFAGDPTRTVLTKRGLTIAGASSSVVALHVLVALSGDRVVGILPLMLQDVLPSGGKTTLRCLTFLGDHVFVPNPTLRVAAGMEDPVNQLFADHVASFAHWAVILLFPIRPSQQTLQALLRKLAELLPAATDHRPLQRKRFEQQWNRPRVSRCLRLLVGPDATPATQELQAFVERLDRMAPAEFRRECLSSVTPELRALLASPEGWTGNARGLAIEVATELEQFEPYVYQWIVLPDSMDAYLGRLPRKYRQFLKRAEAHFVGAGYRVDVEAHAPAGDWQRFVDLHQARHPRSAYLTSFTESYCRRQFEQAASTSNLLWVRVHDAHGTALLLAAVSVAHGRQTLGFVIVGTELATGDHKYIHLALCHVIRHGIEHGYPRLDLRMGNEAYKRKFVPEREHLHAWLATRDPGAGWDLLPSFFRPGGTDGDDGRA